MVPNSAIMLTAMRAMVTEKLAEVKTRRSRSARSRRCSTSCRTTNAISETPPTPSAIHIGMAATAASSPAPGVAPMRLRP